jgi:hypothetical protein
MSNKNILRKKFGNMYGKDKPLNGNTPINNIIKNITPNNTNYNNNFVSYDSKLSNTLETTTNSSIMPIIIILIILIIIFGLIYLFRNKIYNYLLELWNDYNKNNSQISDFIKKIFQDSKTKKEEEEKKKKEEEDLKKEKSQIEQEKENEKKKELEKNSGLNQLNQKVNDLSNYRKDQIATSNGFCYIGYDLGQRECTDIYTGEVCMSGQIFPTMDVCLNPKLRT